MKCGSCHGSGVVTSEGLLRDCDSCCGTGICPVPEVGATQAAIDYLRAEFYAPEPARRMVHFRTAALRGEPRKADAV